MWSRLLGQETEYAIRFTPLAEGTARPIKRQLAAALIGGIKQLVKSRPGERAWSQSQVFVENGGAFCFEPPPGFPHGGMLEGATPECTSPRELLRYQRAQESLLLRAIPLAEAQLLQEGFNGRIGLLKNCRDAEGNYYGTQENYQAPVSNRTGVLLMRAAMIALLPFIAFFLLVALLLLVFVTLILLCTLLLVWIFSRLMALLSPPAKRRGRFALLDGWVQRQLEEEAFASHLGWLEQTFYWCLVVLAMPFTWVLRLVAFRPQRRALEAFVISRIIFTGAGRLEPDGRFSLSEKASGIRYVVRWFIKHSERVIFDSGNLHKRLVGCGLDVLLWRWSGFHDLFKVQQRFQIGLADANRCQTAEYLRTATTLLALELQREGWLEDAPRLVRPVRALRQFTFDASLASKATMRDGSQMSALEIQRFYFTRAKEFLAQHPEAEECRSIVRMWGATLDWLELDPGLLIGHVDWVTKRYLLETAGHDQPFEVRKKIDLGYHELGIGYFEEFEKTHVAPVLVHPEEVERAQTEPSSAPGARTRSRWIRAANEGDACVISWNFVRVGRWWRRRTIRFPQG